MIAKPDSEGYVFGKGAAHPVLCHRWSLAAQKANDLWSPSVVVSNQSPRWLTILKTLNSELI
ncbi:MAG: hypothetical protein D6714_09020 [Bacteroidetes bacterium]|nr:MAG: hypothetical protein D6714_09020 [Bacteroidota bacterium]